jgi:hypothetical protein
MGIAGIAGEEREGVPVGVVEEFRPVGEGADHLAGVHEVEFLGEFPWFFGVVYYEFYVWWDPV